MRFAAGPAEAGARLDRALAAWLAEPRTHAEERIARGEVTIDGRPARKSHRLVEGEEVVVATRAAAEPVTAPPMPPVRHEDEHLLVVAKPPGLVVHAGAGVRGATLVAALEAAGITLAASPAGGPHRPGIVHRLDRDTSGLMVVAKTEAARDGLVESLREHRVERQYIALAEGSLPSPTGRIELPIDRHQRDRTRMAVSADGRTALTSWRTISSAETRGQRPVTLLWCELGTGRTHQIRVHLSHIRHPVVGDLRYGASRDVADDVSLSRPFLHAARLSFAHPVTGERVEVAEPLPADLLAALAVVGLDAPK